MTELTIVSISIGLIGIVLACIFYGRSRKEKKPQIKMMSFNLISKSLVQVRPDRIQVTFSGQVVENMTITNVAFWNAGKEPIRAEDVASQEPIRIVAREGCRILEAEVVQVNNPSNALRCEQFGDEEVIIQFEYLEKSDGAVIQVFHTGQKSSDLRFVGKIIGTTLVTVKSSFTSKLIPNKVYQLTMLVVIMASLVGFNHFAEHKQVWIGSLFFIPFGIYLFIIILDLFLDTPNKELPPTLDLLGGIQLASQESAARDIEKRSGPT